MQAQKFDFEAFSGLYNRAVEGLQDAQLAVRGLPQETLEVADSIGSAKFKSTCESLNESCNALDQTFQSVFDAAEEVKRFYEQLNAGVN